MPNSATFLKKLQHTNDSTDLYGSPPERRYYFLDKLDPDMKKYNSKEYKI